MPLIVPFTSRACPGLDEPMPTFGVKLVTPPLLATQLTAVPEGNLMQVSVANANPVNKKLRIGNKKIIIRRISPQYCPVSPSC